MKIRFFFISFLILFKLAALEEMNGWRKTNFANPPRPLREVDLNSQLEDVTETNPLFTGNINSKPPGFRQIGETYLRGTQTDPSSGNEFNLSFDFEEFIKTHPQDPQTILQSRQLVYQLQNGFNQAIRDYPMLIDFFNPHNIIDHSGFISMMNELFSKAINDINFISYFLLLGNYFYDNKMTNFNCQNITSNILKFSSFVNKQWNSIYNILKPYQANSNKLEELFGVINKFLEIDNLQAIIFKLTFPNNHIQYNKFCILSFETALSLYMHNYTIFMNKIIEITDILYLVNLDNSSSGIRYSFSTAQPIINKVYTNCSASVPLYDTSCTLPNCIRGSKIIETLYQYSPERSERRYWSYYSHFESKIDNLPSNQIKDGFYKVVSFMLPNVIGQMVFKEAYYSADVYYQNGTLANSFQIKWELKS